MEINGNYAAGARDQFIPAPEVLDQNPRALLAELERGRRVLMQNNEQLNAIREENHALRNALAERNRELRNLENTIRDLRQLVQMHPIQQAQQAPAQPVEGNWFWEIWTPCANTIHQLAAPTFGLIRNNGKVIVAGATIVVAVTGIILHATGDSNASIFTVISSMCLGILNNFMPSLNN